MQALWACGGWSRREGLLAEPGERGADVFLEGTFEFQVTHNFLPGLAATRRLKILFLAPTSWSFLGFTIKFRVVF